MLAQRFAPALVLVLAAACASRESGPAAPVAAPAPEPKAPAGPTPPALRLDGSVVPSEYAIELTLDPARPDFRGVASIAVTLKSETRQIWLHGKRLEVTSATVTGASGKPVTATVAPSGELLGLTLAEPVGPGLATLRFEYAGQMPTTEQEGVFRQSEGGHTYIFTQFEATGARLAFPSFDEPSFKVPWQLTLHVPDGMVALSNTPVEKESTTGNLRSIVFKRTRPMPSYLVAFTVGPFDMIDLGRAGRNKTPMRIAVLKGRASEARYARKVTGQLLAALEKYFDIPYPYEKLDSVVVPTFLGAMENVGLVTYSARAILAKPNEETPAFKEGYASIAAHELAHHWFGDLVTMVWWDDIWLNESFATFMADRVVDDWQPSWGVQVSRIKGAQGAFATDSLVTARKVHNPIREHNDIVGAFDAISYQKGGALLDMFEAWMGRPSFQKAIHRYLTEHAWGNATSRDFIAALAAESKPEIASAFEGFIEQGGIPLVSLALECAAGKPPELALGQERFLPVGSKGSAAQTWSVPMCVGFPRGAKTAVQCFLMNGAKARVALDTEECPPWIDGNAGGHGYYRVSYAGDLGQKLFDQGDLDTAGRVAALFNTRAMVDAGHGKMSDLLAVIPSVAKDRDPEIVGTALELAVSVDPFVGDAERDGYNRFLARSFAGPARAIGWRPRRGESVQVSKLRPQLLGLVAMHGADPALVAAARKLAQSFMANPRSLDPLLGGVVLATAVRSGDARLFDRLEAAFNKTEDHNFRAALLAGMVMSRDPVQRDRTIAHLSSGKLTLEELATLAFIGISDPSTREPVWDHVIKNMDQVLAALPFLVRPALAQLGTAFCDAEHRKIVDTVFRAKLEKLPGGQKQLDEVLEKMDLCIARRAKLGPDVAAFLARQ
jgi:alanyl aminopeptidase